MEGLDYTQRYWEDVAEGQPLPEIEDPITYRRVIMNPAATWDYFPGHYDPEYARSQGRPTIYVNTMHLLAFVDRTVTAWAGPATFIRRRRVRVRGSIHAGDTMISSGTVVRRYTDEQAGVIRHLVDLELDVRNQHGASCCPATVTVELPTRGAAARPRGGLT